MQIYWNPHGIRTRYPFLTEVEDQEALRRGHCYRPLHLFTYKSSRSTDKISDLRHSLTRVRNLRPAQKFFPQQFNRQKIHRFTNRSDTTYCKWICRRIVKTKFISQHKWTHPGLLIGQALGVLKLGGQRDLQLAQLRHLGLRLLQLPQQVGVLDG